MELLEKAFIFPHSFLPSPPPWLGNETQNGKLLQKYFPRLFPFLKAPKRDGKKKKKKRTEYKMLNRKEGLHRGLGEGLTGGWVEVGARSCKWGRAVHKLNFFGFVGKPQQFLSTACKTSSDFHVYN